MSAKPRQSHISPADIMSKPTVLTVPDLMDVLQVGEHSIGELVSSGQLHRLAYSRREIRVFKGEVIRFLEQQSGWQL